MAGHQHRSRATLKGALLILIGAGGVLLVMRDALRLSDPLVRFEKALADVTRGTANQARLPLLAQTALRSEPLDAEAVMFATAPGQPVSDAGTAHRLALAETVDKRSLAVQLGLIEAAVAQGDVRRALVHYDRAMTTHQQSTDIFFPVLKAAIENSDIRMGLVPYIRAGRAWTYPFVQYLLDNVPSQTVAAFFRTFGGGRQVAAVRPFERILLARLVASGAAAEARRYAATMRADGAPGLDSLGVNGNSADPAFGPLAWSVEEGNIDTSVRAGRVEATVPPGASGGLATRVMVARAGPWRLSYVLAAEGDSPPHLAWDASCLIGAGEEPLWSEVVSATAQAVAHQATVTIPVRCQAVRFRLRVDGSEAQLDSHLRLSQMALDRRE